MTAPPAVPQRLANTRLLYRADITRRLVALLDRDEAVIGGIGNTHFDLWAAGHRRQNFYMLGSMGLACPIALGVAIAQPHRHVFALEGDGSLLMELGALATIAARAPKNLTIVVMDNRAYQITGAQPTATAFAADLVEAARGLGIARSQWAADEADFERLVQRAREAQAREPQAREEGGPTLIGVHLDHQPPAGQTERDPVIIRDRFMRGIGTKPPHPA